MKRPAVLASAIFLAAAILLLALHGNRVVLTNDEGILLEPAQRIAFGARPYADFWTYMSPGSYWLQAAVFRLLGVSLITGRLVVILDFALQCALVFWLSSRLASKAAAAAIAWAFAGFQMADPTFLTAQHRWDSATLALAGVAVAAAASSSSRWRWLSWGWFAGGALLAAAAWCTPAVATVGCAVGLWLLMVQERRPALLPLLAGIAAVSLAAACWLIAKGCFGAFLAQMLWLKKNYSASNIMPYGSIIGGYGALFADSTSWSDRSVRSVLVACIALPAVLPPLALAGYGIARWRHELPSGLRAPVGLLLLCLIAMVLTVFPRADVAHLAYAAALPYILGGTVLARLLPRRAAFFTAAAAVVLATIFASNFFRSLGDTARLDSPVGVLRVAKSDVPSIQGLLAAVRPQQKLFVYPYLPIEYFLTQAKNPTRYAYLNPGMSTPADEQAVLADLQAQPPEWILYLKLSREEFLRVFPHGSGLDWRFETLESWLQQNYHPSADPPISVGGYQLWRRQVPAVVESAAAHTEKPAAVRPRFVGN